MAAHPTVPSTEGDLGLALAMVVSSTAPLLLFDEHQKIIAASASFCEAFAIAPDAVTGRELHELGQGEWDVPQLRSLIDATASGDAQVPAYEMDLQVGAGSRRLIVNVKRLSYQGSPGQGRLLVTVGDVTEARANRAARQQLISENEMLLQEVRHRIANSLQIIASVLMQSARRTQSEETRAHLRDAHHRVMSVADLQRQLAISTFGAVRLCDYLTKLCGTIRASMIADAGTLTLTVECEDVLVDAGISVSLGLIVTELVINALKHGFPDGRGGEIKVSYVTDKEAWRLAVNDNGRGMPSSARNSKGGLGTSIVQALAHQLDAKVHVGYPRRGAEVTVTHGPQTAIRRASKSRRAPARAAASGPTTRGESPKPGLSSAAPRL